MKQSTKKMQALIYSDQIDKLHEKPTIGKCEEQNYCENGYIHQVYNFPTSI